MVDFLRFEHRRQRLATRRVFLWRLGRNLLLGLGILIASMAMGMAGYVYFEDMNLVDAYDTTAMILSGMGPFQQASTAEGMIFEGTYALYAGLVVLVITGLILAPVFHRVVHSLHVEDGSGPEGPKDG